MAVGPWLFDSVGVGADKSWIAHQAEPGSISTGSKPSSNVKTLITSAQKAHETPGTVNPDNLNCGCGKGQTISSEFAEVEVRLSGQFSLADISALPISTRQPIGGSG